MKTLIIYAHPIPDSFNQSILQVAMNVLKRHNHPFTLRDLYAEPLFQPILTEADLTAQYSKNPNNTSQDILQEQALISESEALLFIYPTWWYSQPAVLKGWLDRVWTQGFAFKGSIGLLKHKLAMVINSFGSAGKNPNINDISKLSIIKTLEFCGIMNTVYHPTFSIDNEPSKSKLNDKLIKIEGAIEHTFAT